MVNHTLFGDVAPSYYFFYNSRCKEATPTNASECAVPAYSSDLMSIVAFTLILVKAAVLALCGVDCVKTNVTTTAQTARTGKVDYSAPARNNAAPARKSDSAKVD